MPHLPTILNGTLCARLMQEQMSLFLKESAKDLAPRLDVFLIGDDPASATYVKAKQKAARRLGLQTEIHHFPSSISLEYTLEQIAETQKSKDNHGVLVQLPLPASWPKNSLWQLIQGVAAEKDVDGFHPINQSTLQGNCASLKPCTPMGILSLLKIYGIATEGKNICIIGRSSIVGSPLQQLLSHKSYENYNLGLGNATVTLCHSQTRDLASHCRQADIVIAAAGRAGLVQGAMLKQGAVLIDVGINRVDAPESSRGYRLVGDCDFPSVAQHCDYISPVPGGVGPMTITWLLYNTLNAALRQSSKEPFQFNWKKLQAAVRSENSSLSN